MVEATQSQFSQSQISINQTHDIRQSMSLVNQTYKLERQSINGLLTLKRSNLWVARYAEVKNCIFTYKKKQCKCIFE